MSCNMKLLMLVLAVSLDNGFGYSVQGGTPTQVTLKWPPVFHLKGDELNLYTRMKTTFEMWYSEPHNRSRIDYYEGVSKFYYHWPTGIDNGTLYELCQSTKDVGVSSETICYQPPYEKKPALMLPRPTNVKAKGSKKYNGRQVFVWTNWENITELKIDSLEHLEIVAYPHQDYYVPVEITRKLLNITTKNLRDHRIIKYYNFNETVLLDDLDVFKVTAEPCEKIEFSQQSLKPGAVHYNSQLDVDFQKYKKQHNKIYDTDEHEMRKTIFQGNLKRVTEHNKNNLSYKMEINEFSDRTDEELFYLTGSKISTESLKGKKGHPFLYTREDVADLPKELDLREEGFVTPIKHQANCGSCWAFSTTAAVEGVLAKNNGGRKLDLSEQSLIDCAERSTYMSGCYGGHPILAAEYLYDNGIPTELEYGPYLAKNGRCNFQKMTTVYNISAYSILEDDEQVKVALNKYGPVVAVVHASKNMKLYSHGIFKDPECSGESATPNHGVTIVGYGVKDNENYWIVKNSWGESWGQDGFILLTSSNGTCLSGLNMSFNP